MTFWDYVVAHPWWTLVYLFGLCLTAEGVAAHLGRRRAGHRTFTVRCDKCNRVIASETTSA